MLRRNRRTTNEEERLVPPVPPVPIPPDVPQPDERATSDKLYEAIYNKLMEEPKKPSTLERIVNAVGRAYGINWDTPEQAMEKQRQLRDQQLNKLSAVYSITQAREQALKEEERYQTAQKQAAEDRARKINVEDRLWGQSQEEFKFRQKKFELDQELAKLQLEHNRETNAIRKHELETRIAQMQADIQREQAKLALSLNKEEFSQDLRNRQHDLQEHRLQLQTRVAEQKNEIAKMQSEYSRETNALRKQELETRIAQMQAAIQREQNQLALSLNKEEFSQDLRNRQQTLRENQFQLQAQVAEQKNEIAQLRLQQGQERDQNRRQQIDKEIALKERQTAVSEGRLVLSTGMFAHTQEQDTAVLDLRTQQFQLQRDIASANQALNTERLEVQKKQLALSGDIAADKQEAIKQSIAESQARIEHIQSRITDSTARLAQASQAREFATQLAYENRKIKAAETLFRAGLQGVNPEFLQTAWGFSPEDAQAFVNTYPTLKDHIDDRASTYAANVTNTKVLFELIKRSDYNSLASWYQELEASGVPGDSTVGLAIRTAYEVFTEALKTPEVGELRQARELLTDPEGLGQAVQASLEEEGITGVLDDPATLLQITDGTLANITAKLTDRGVEAEAISKVTSLIKNAANSVKNIASTQGYDRVMSAMSNLSTNTLASIALPSSGANNLRFVSKEEAKAQNQLDAAQIIYDWQVQGEHMLNPKDLSDMYPKANPQILNQAFSGIQKILQDRAIESRQQQTTLSVMGVFDSLAKSTNDKPMAAQNTLQRIASGEINASANDIALLEAIASDGQTITSKMINDYDSTIIKPLKEQIDNANLFGGVSTEERTQLRNDLDEAVKTRQLLADSYAASIKKLVQNGEATLETASQVQEEQAAKVTANKAVFQRTMKPFMTKDAEQLAGRLAGFGMVNGVYESLNLPAYNFQGKEVKDATGRNLSMAEYAAFLRTQNFNDTNIQQMVNQSLQQHYDSASDVAVMQIQRQANMPNGEIDLVRQNVKALAGTLDPDRRDVFVRELISMHDAVTQRDTKDTIQRRVNAAYDKVTEPSWFVRMFHDVPASYTASQVLSGLHTSTDSFIEILKQKGSGLEDEVLSHVASRIRTLKANMPKSLLPRFTAKLNSMGNALPASITEGKLYTRINKIYNSVRGVSNNMYLSPQHKPILTAEQLLAKDAESAKSAKSAEGTNVIDSPDTNPVTSGTDSPATTDSPGGRLQLDTSTDSVGIFEMGDYPTPVLDTGGRTLKEVRRTVAMHAPTVVDIINKRGTAHLALSRILQNIYDGKYANADALLKDANLKSKIKNMDAESKFKVLGELQKYYNFMNPEPSLSPE